MDQKFFTRTCLVEEEKKSWFQFLIVFSGYPQKALSCLRKFKKIDLSILVRKQKRLCLIYLLTRLMVVSLQKGYMTFLW